jgi:uncharacterized protein (TIGR02466 family)
MDTNHENVQDVLEIGSYFPTPVYYINKPEFVAPMLEVFNEYVKNTCSNKLNDLYPSIMTANMVHDPRAQDFGKYVVSSAWNVLNAQGYDMATKVTYFHSMWGQHHYKYGGMDEHIHNDTVQLVGFYFLECPEKCPKLVLHDPRAGKRQIGLAEADLTKVTEASSGIVFQPKVGSLFITNAWLPHSITRNGSNDAFKFIHFNISVRESDATVAATKNEAIVI